jgi:hypothetical protein
VLGKGECELRQVFQDSDFPADVFPPEQAEREAALRQEMPKNAAAR